MVTEKEIEAEAWRIVHEYAPRWWNEYFRLYPKSTVSDKRLRELCAHACVTALLASQSTPAPPEVGELVELRREIEQMRIALRMPDADRRQWFLSDLIARVGHFNRADLCTAFGVSVPQASHDIRRFIEAFPHVATYNKSTKRYERKELPS